jgi:hypothetical protein
MGQPLKDRGTARPAPGFCHASHQGFVDAESSVVNQ